jgi:hypothetical protein
MQSTLHYEESSQESSCVEEDVLEKELELWVRDDSAASKSKYCETPVSGTPSVMSTSSRLFSANALASGSTYTGSSNGFGGLGKNIRAAKNGLCRGGLIPIEKL